MSSHKLFKIILFTFFVIPVFSGITLFASNPLPADSTHITLRQPTGELMESYRSQADFSYTKPPVTTNFLQGLWTFLKEKFGSIEKITAALPWIVKVMLALLVLFFLYVVITQTKVYKIFYSGKEIESPEFQFLSKQNQSIDYNNEIRLQIDQQQFRLAVRLLYLKVIDQLRNKNFIQYSKDKTNLDYLFDLPNNDLKSNFFQVTRIYNHVWYGETEIAKEQFLSFEKSFQSIFSAIDVQE
ncbi:MAG: hypothetical protein ACERKD_09220 [Prolixibacteraceae bacterium]